MDTILSFEKVLVQIEKGISVLSGTGGALGQSELAGLAAAVAVGLLLCLLGLKLIRFWGAVAGLILGAAGGIYGGGYFGLTGRQRIFQSIFQSFTAGHFHTDYSYAFYRVLF